MSTEIKSLTPILTPALTLTEKEFMPPEELDGYKKIRPYVNTTAGDKIVMCRISIIDTDAGEKDYDSGDDEEEGELREDDGDEANTATNNEWVHYLHKWIINGKARGVMRINMTNDEKSASVRIDDWHKGNISLTVRFTGAKVHDLAELVLLLRRSTPRYFCIDWIYWIVK